jgi:hypothetical protein
MLPKMLEFGPVKEILAGAAAVLTEPPTGFVSTQLTGSYAPLNCADAVLVNNNNRIVAIILK